MALGLALLGIAVGLGGGSLILNNRLAYETLRWAGALYLCWLAYDSWREGRRPIEAAPVSQSHFLDFARICHQPAQSGGRSVLYRRRPEFISGPAPSVRELAILVSIDVAVATFVHGLIVLLAGGLQAFFCSSTTA